MVASTCTSDALPSLWGISITNFEWAILDADEVEVKAEPYVQPGQLYLLDRKAMDFVPSDDPLYVICHPDDYPTISQIVDELRAARRTHDKGETTEAAARAPQTEGEER